MGRDARPPSVARGGTPFAPSDAEVVVERATFWLALASVPGCVVGFGCSEIGCLSTLTLAVTGAAIDGRDIDVTVVVGGQIAQCAGTVIDGALACEGLEISETATGWEANVALTSGDEEPAQAQVLVTLDGVTAFDGDVDVTWGDPFRPNGPMCEPVCVGGEAEIAL